MRTLLLMRHAKSDRSRPELPDIERPLAPRGVRAATTIGSFLTATGWAPDLVVSSPAERALATARTAGAAGGWGCSARSDPRLYEADAEDLLGIVTELDAGAARVLLCGHEPGWSELASLLIGGGRVRLPTAAVAAVAFEVESWSGVDPGSGVLQWLVTPRLVGPALAGGGS